MKQPPPTAREEGTEVRFIISVACNVDRQCGELLRPPASAQNGRIEK
jgi:hypothetical protein